jgi:opacity protein-like surface antigen
MYRGESERQRAGFLVHPHPEPMRVHRLITAAMVVLAAPSLLSAQTIPSPYRFIETRKELGAFGGWISPGTGRFGYGPGPGPVTGVRAGLDFDGPFSIEAVVGGIPTTRAIVDPRRVEGDREIGETEVTLITADARLKLGLTGARTWHGLNPFVTAGAGLAWDLGQSSPLEQDLPATDRFDFGTAFVAQVGGGVRWFVTEAVVVRGDGLLHLWRLKAPAGFRDPERGFGDIGEAEWINAGSFTFGIGYRF